MQVIYFASFILLLQGVNCEFDETQFTHNRYLDSTENYQLFWNYDEAEGTITFGARVKTTGYIGLGISENGGMVDSDIFIGWVSNAEVYGQDRYAVTESLPPIDINQDVEVISGEEDATYTTIVFKRPLALCDSDDRTISVGATKLIWSFGESDPDNNDEDALDYHGNNRGTKTVYLLDDTIENIELPDDTVTLNFLNDNLQIPDDVDTTYWCHAFKLPDFGGEKHMIKVEPVVQEGNELLVHHILIYECFDPDITDDYDDFNHKCYDEGLGPLLTCKTVFIAWAIGGEAFYFPENVGYPLGLDDSPKFVLMEVHYDNPNYAQNSGNVDSSGIRIHYTAQLREHRAGIFMFGISVGGTEVIPPDSEEFTASGVCPNACIDKSFSDELEEVTLFAGMMHSHLAGEALKARHFRDGIELQPILVDDSYDFDLQEMRPINNVILKKGDSVVTDCVCNTEGREVVTYGGRSTDEEMCLSFLYYYPKIGLKSCLSSPSLEDILEGATGETGFELTQQFRDWIVVNPEMYRDLTYNEVLENNDWNDNLRKQLESVYLNKGYSLSCIDDGPEDEFVTSQSAFEILKEWSEEIMCNNGTSEIDATTRIDDTATESISQAPSLKTSQWTIWTFTVTVVGITHLTF